MSAVKKGQLVFLSTMTVLLFLGTAFSGTAQDHVKSAEASGHEQDGWWESWPGDTDNNGLDDRLDELINTGHEFDSDTTVDILIDYNHLPQQNDIERLEGLNLQLTYISSYINTVAVRNVPMSLLSEIQALPGVVMIEQQPVYRTLLDTSVPAMKVSESGVYTNVARDFGVTGDGVVIAIIDTGVDDDHNSLDDDRYIAGADFSGSFVSFTNPDDKDGHGTHVAGIALGNGGADEKYVGVAPKAGLVDVKVFNDWSPTTSADNVMNGVEWCMDNMDRYSIDVLSLSIGDLFVGNDDGTGSQAQLVNSAVDAGLVVVVAAGNDGPDNNGFSSLAAAEKVITVGSIDDRDTIDRDDDRISDFSSRGPRADDGDPDKIDEFKPDVCAPGDGIMSAMHAASVFVDPGNNYIEKSGTSMAAPHVAGLAALLLEANPALTPADVKDMIRETAAPMGSPYNKGIDDQYNKDYGWGIVDAYEALKLSFGDYQRAEIISFEEGDTLAGIVNIIGYASNDKGPIVSVELSFNAGATWHKATGTDNWNYSWDSSSAPNGNFVIFVRTSNGTAYSKEFKFSVNLLNVLPSITFPYENSKVKGTVRVEGALAARHPVNHVEVRIDDGEWKRAIDRSEDGSWSTWYYTWYSENQKDGTHKVSARTFVDGVYSKEVSVQVKVKNNEDSPGFESILVLIAFAAVISLMATARIRSRRSR